MAKIMKSSLFDDEIARTSRELEELINANAPFVEVDACHVKLSSLIEEKRKHLYSAPDPSYYLDQFFACPTIDTRREIAKEFAESVLSEINEILEADGEYDPVDLETYSSILDFFIHFSYHNKDRSSEELEAIAGEEARESTAAPSVRYISEFTDLSPVCKLYMGLVMDQLVLRGFLTRQNARYLKGRFSNSAWTTGFSRNVTWEKDAKSLATTFVVANALGENALGDAKIDSKTKRNEAFLIEPEIQPNFASFLFKNFHVLIGGSSNPTFFRVSQKVQGDLNVFWDLVKMIREKLRPSYAPQKPVVTNEDLLLYFFDRIQNAPDEDATIRNQCPNLCYPVLEAFAEGIRTDRLRSNV